MCVFDIMAHMSVPCHEGPPATKGHFSSEPAVAGGGRYYCIVLSVIKLTILNLTICGCYALVKLLTSL